MFGIEFQSLRDVWYHNLEKFPRKVAAIDGGAPGRRHAQTGLGVAPGDGDAPGADAERQGYTYAECDLLSDRLRGRLEADFSLRPGDRVALAGPNCIEYYLAYWAVMKAGGVVVPVNVRLGLDEMRHILAASDAGTLFVHRANWRAVRDAMRGAGTVRHVIGMGFGDAPQALQFPDQPGEAEPDRPQGVIPFEALIASGGPCTSHPDIRPEDLAIIMHTSGTTGRPKGAMMRHGDLLFNNRLAVYAHSLRHEDVHLLFVPMFHPTAAYSLLPTSALLGSTLVLAPKGDVRPLAELIQAHRATTFFGVPSLFRLLATWPHVKEYDLSSLRLIAYAGSPMPPATIRLLRGLFPGVKLHNFFGLTETISMTHVLADCDADAHPDSIGKLLPHVRQRILDEQGGDVAPGEVGELHFHRANVICGYWKDPDRLAASLKGDWFNTGDLASVDEAGFVTIKGRSKDMIIVGGENVYALEVENCILMLPGVAEVAVVGVPATGVRAHLGELVKAVVVAEPGARVTEADVKRHCMERLATYKVPQLVEFRDSLPRNPGGKVLKRLLQ